MSGFAAKVRSELKRGDVAVLFVALTGLAAFVIVLPRTHVDAFTRVDVPASEAAEVARNALELSGYDTSESASSVSIARDSPVLTRLQQSMGRRAFGGWARTGGLETVPAYYYDVRFHSAEGSGFSRRLVERHSVRVTLGGRVWRIDPEVVESGGPPGADDNRPSTDSGSRTTVVNRAALQSAISSSGPDGSAASKLVRQLPDSVLARLLGFDGAAFPQRLADPGFGERSEDVSVDSLLEAGETVSWGAAMAVALARYHLDNYPLSELVFRPDSAWVGSVEEVVVRFRADVVEAGLEAEADVAITPQGGLRLLDVHFPFEAPSETPRLRVTSEVFAGAVYAVLGLLLLVSFFRRLFSRSIDVKAALMDGLVFATVLVVAMLLERGLLFGPTNAPVWVRMGLAVGLLTIVGGGMCVIIFVMTSAGDSLLRAKWSQKLFTTGLLRQGSVFNPYVGRALIHGIAIGFVALGFTAALLLVVGDAPQRLTDEMLNGETFVPFVAVAGVGGWLTYVQTVVLVVTTVALLYRRDRSKWVPAIGVVLVCAVAQIGLEQFDSVWLDWLASGVLGALLAFAIIRYDALTTFIALFTGYLLWNLSEGWLVSGSGLWVDVLIASLLIGGILVGGLVGLARTMEAGSIREYVPPYIKELKREERQRQELEIARRVHESFLPKRMPDMPGLDVAAACLAAYEVGGDYYDFVQVGPSRLAIAVGDVSGKGIQAAFFMTLTKGFLRSLCRQFVSPAEVLRRLNVLFCENAPRGTFVSMIYGVVDLEDRTFTFARAGHNPVIMKRSPSEVSEIIQPSGLGIGLAGSDVFDSAINEVSIPINAGDVLVLYTDGISEARNARSEEFGDSTLAHRVAEMGDRPAREILDAISADVLKFMADVEQHDDMTIVIVKVAPSIERPELADAAHAVESA